MSLPRLLLVDDSAAVLAYCSAALAGGYALSTAANGREALERLAEQLPSLMLLDLSMPEMSGDEVLERMRADPTLREVPVLVISSEVARAQACLKKGAVAFMAKPVKAEALRVEVERVLAEVAAKRRAVNVNLLLASVATRTVALPLAAVRQVLLHPATHPLAVGHSYLRHAIELEGRLVAVLDMARPLDVQHRVRRVDRTLVVVDAEATVLALCFDQVRDPIELLPDRVVARIELAGEDPSLIARAIRAVAMTDDGPVPVIEPAALLSRAVLRRLATACAAGLAPA